MFLNANVDKLLKVAFSFTFSKKVILQLDKEYSDAPNEEIKVICSLL